MSLGRVKKRLDKFKKAADIDAAFAEIVSSEEFKKLAVELNTKGKDTSQLYELGIDSLGKTLDVDGYAASTIEGTASFKGKKEKGQRFDHITLEDTGKFYSTFVVETGGSSFLFRITANPIRGNANLFEGFGKEIVGWTEQNLQIMIDFIRERIVPIIKRKMAA